VTLGDADLKMIYRKLPKTASLSVTCHPLRTNKISLSRMGMVIQSLSGLESHTPCSSRLFVFTAPLSDNDGMVGEVCSGEMLKRGVLR
jgi:hypothetical protein